MMERDAPMTPLSPDAVERGRAVAWLALALVLTAAVCVAWWLLLSPIAWLPRWVMWTIIVVYAASNVVRLFTKPQRAA